MFPPKKQRKIEKKIKTEDDIEDFGAKEELPEDEGEDEGEDEAEGEGEVEGEGEEGENEDLDYEEEIEETVYTTSNGKDNYQKILGKKFDKSIEPSAIRPPIPKIDPKKDNLAFCQTDCDYYTGIQKPGFAGPGLFSFHFPQIFLALGILFQNSPKFFFFSQRKSTNCSLLWCNRQWKFSLLSCQRIYSLFLCRNTKKW